MTEYAYLVDATERGREYTDEQLQQLIYMKPIPQTQQQTHPPEK